MNLSELSVEAIGEKTNWTKINIKGQIRSVLGERIVGLCKGPARNLKHKIAPLAIPASALLLTTSGTQSGLNSFEVDQANKSSEDTSGDSKADKSDRDTPYAESQESGIDDEGRGLTGIIYARVSSDKQINGNDDDQPDDDQEGDDQSEEYDDGSIQGQIDELKDLAKKEGIDIDYDPIVDQAKTGTNFDRDGIQEVFEIAKRKNVDYLLVEKVDRIGRSAPETLYFIYILQSKCDVMLLTPAGERDINKVEGLMQTTLLSLMAEVQNDIRTAKAKKERIRGFLQKKNWKCRSPIVPLGYNETDDGWLEVNPEEKQIARDVFKIFVECENYAQTERRIQEKYGTEALKDHRVKTLLQYSVYIGKPKLPEEWITETTFDNELEDQNLHLLREGGRNDNVSEETFHQAQEIVKEKQETHSSDESSLDLLDFIEEFSLFAVVEGSESATLLHHCGEPLVKDGQRDLRGRKVHRYRCHECEEAEDPESYYRQWPRQDELDRIELLQRMVDGDTEYFDQLT